MKLVVTSALARLSLLALLVAAAPAAADEILDDAGNDPPQGDAGGDGDADGGGDGDGDGDGDEDGASGCRHVRTTRGEPALASMAAGLVLLALARRRR